MKTCTLLLFLVLGINANAAPKSLKCVDTKNRSDVAALTFLNDGTGNLLWEEDWHSSASIAELSSSKEVGDIYRLRDFYSDQSGVYELVLKPELAKSHSKGRAEVRFGGSLVATYNCK